MKKRIVVLTLITICLSMLLVIGGTYALFTDKEVVNNHLKAGTLDIGLERIKYVSHELNDDGLFTDKVDETPIDLTEDASSIFLVENIVPTAYYEATIKVTNKGTIAFDYWVEINCPVAVSSELANQIFVIVTDKDANKAQFKLSECVNKKIELGSILTTENQNVQEFKVEIQFLDLENNNDVMNMEVNVDITVSAIQKK